MSAGHDQPWQVYAENGLAINGKSATREDFSSDTSLVMGAAHVWVWRRSSEGVEVLLQKRASDKRTWPGYYDISAAGHIDAGEDAVGAAVREAAEEIGVTLRPDDLYYIFGIRTPLDGQEIDTVFTYELTHEVGFSLNDGEAEELVWKSLDDFEAMTINPDQSQLVPQGAEYFGLLLASLRRY